MHWSKERTEATVKMKQDFTTITLRKIYLVSQKRSQKKQRGVRQKVKIASLLRQSIQPSVVVKKGNN